MKKIILLLILILGISSCSSKKYYTLDHLWHCSIDNTSYDISYEASNDEKISFAVKVDSIENEHIPLYFKANEYISCVEYDGKKYDEIQYERYYGELPYSNNEFIIHCYLSEKGKETNYKYISLNMEKSINSLIISNKMERIHYIEINFKK